MRALVEHHLSLTEQAIVDAELTAPSPNAVATALVHVSRKFCDVKRPRAQEGAMAAFVEDPSLFDPVRTYHRRVVDRLRASAADPDLSLIALLTLEGIKAHDVLALDFLQEAERKRILERLAALLQQGT